VTSRPQIATSPIACALPAGAGVGAKPQHYQRLIEDEQAPDFVEVHAENFMGEGGAPHAWLERLRERFPLSIHGVGLSIGGEEPLDRQHLARLKRLIDRYQPESFSEHLAWSSHGGNYFNDLLPLRYDRHSLERVCRHIDQVQERLGRRILLENPATYVEFSNSDMDESAFLCALVDGTGCGLLLDVNNAYVSGRNHGRDPLAAIEALPLKAVGEIHLSGHSRELDAAGADLLIDDHGSAVADPVWTLFETVIARIGPRPTLVEWDNEVPGYEVLREQADQARRRLRSVLRSAA
jgi:uncharacterized protein (UPF0276 family)